MARVRGRRSFDSAVFAMYLFATPAWGQAPAARALAAKVDAHYNALRSLRVEFTQVYDGLGLHREERGTLLLAKAGRFGPGRMRWIYSEPAGKLFVLDGKDGYFYTPGQAEVERVPAKKLDDLRSPLALLLGHAELAKQLNGLTVTSGADGSATLAGVPRGLEQRVSRLAVTAGPDGVIRELEVDELDGARNRFRFAGEQANTPAPAAAFVFTPPEGTRIVSGLPPV